MRIGGSFENFAVSPVDGMISLVQGEKLTSMGATAKLVELAIPGAQPVKVFCLDHRQIAYAIKDWKAAFPSGRVSIVDHDRVEAGTTKLTGGGPAYADEWIVVNDKVAINPLALRLLAFAKKDIRSSFEHELQANGLLADLV